MAEGIKVQNSDLLDRLATASDAPRDSEGNIRRQQLNSFAGRWVRAAWGDNCGSLPDEDNADLSKLGGVRESFHRMVKAALLSPPTLGEVKGRDGITRTERRSVAAWLERYAFAEESRPNQWYGLRSFM